MSRDDLELIGFWFFFVGIWMVVGIAFVVHARQMDRKVERLRRFGRRTTAVVADYEYRRDKDGDAVPYPLVRFRTPDGRLVTAQTDFGGSFVPAVGDQVDVLFDPSRPEEAHLDSRLSDRVSGLASRVGWGLIIVSAVVGIPLLLILSPMALVVGLMLTGVILAVVVAVRQRQGGRQSSTPAAQAGPWGQRVVSAGWFPDPSRQHELRFWDGQRWTQHVVDSGTRAVDPL
jgi:Protein of unknown function (DUF2510)/Protein of unknown function (DUF3592)